MSSSSSKEAKGHKLRLGYFGDLVGRAGRNAFIGQLATIKAKHSLDLIFVNAENSAGGRGMTPEIGRDLLAAGVNAISLGDHVWDQKSLLPTLEQNSLPLIAPANLPEVRRLGCGYQTLEFAGHKILHINLLGRVFISLLSDCPFKEALSIIKEEQIRTVIIDFHAEATSEKNALLHFLYKHPEQARVSLIVGTHTHVQTADCQIFSNDFNSTGYVSDLGMCGANNSVIGVDATASVSRFLGTPKSFKPEDSGQIVLSGVLAEIELETGACTAIENFRTLI